MSNRILKRTGRVAAALAVGCAVAAPGAHAATATVNLRTAEPFSVLAGSTVINNGGLTTMSGYLGLYAGSAVVQNAPIVAARTYASDPPGVAMRAKTDLTAAHTDAANRPSSASAGSNLAGKTFTTGVYTADSTLLLPTNSTVTLDAQGDTSAVFIFQVGSSLTTGSNSHVALVGGANACNVFWVARDDADLGTGSTFLGTIMAGRRITAFTGATIDGRLLAGTAAVNMDTNTIFHSPCSTPPDNGGGSGGTGGTGDTGGTGGTAGPTGAGNQPAANSQSATPTRAGTARLTRPPRSNTSRRPVPACTAGFRAKVTGRMIRRVIFRIDGRYLGSDTTSAFTQYVKAASAGRHVISARVGFKDATHSKTLKFRYRACAAQALRPRQGPSQFTG